MTFIFLGLLIFCAHLFNAWFSRQRIPDVLLLMIIGILVGPVTGWITPDSLEEIGPVLASLTLLFILFDSGIDMKIDLIRKYWSGVVQVTFLSFLLSMTAVSLLAYFLVKLQMQASMMLGAMVAGTAAAIVIPLVRQMRVSDKTRVTLTLESAISGVLCIVVSLAFIEGYKLGNVSVGSMLGRVLASVLMALVIGTVKDGKPVIMAAGTDEAVAAGFNAGAIIKEISKHIQGGGGGKPQMAQAGGKNPDGLDAALDAAREMLVVK